MRVFDRVAPSVLSLYRIGVGLLFVCHGASSLFGVFGGAQGKGGTVAFGSWPGWWAAVIQLVGGLLVALGLGTRPAALVCSGSMAYAYFMYHQERALLPIENGGESAVMFCWSFVLVAVLGPGRYALDVLLRGAPGRGRSPVAVEPS